MIRHDSITSLNGPVLLRNKLFSLGVHRHCYRMSLIVDSLEDGDGLRKRSVSSIDSHSGYGGILQDSKAFKEGLFSRPSGFDRIPKILRFDSSPTDATGLSFDYLARASIIMSTVFLGPALLELSTEAAKCPSMQDCNERVFGMKPSLLLTNIAMLSGFCSAISMPLIGAIIDHTSYRKEVGALTACALSIIKGLETMISIHTWIYVAMFQVITGVLYSTHITVTYAYVSELSKDPVEQTKYNSFFFVIMYISILLFIAEVMGISTWLGADAVGMARVSQVLTCLSTTLFFGFSWVTLFTPRPVSTPLEEKQSLLLAGFVKLFNTSRYILQEIPEMHMLMWSIMCSESALATLVSIATTYMVHFLAMDSMEVGIAFLLILVMGIPGAKIGEWLALFISPRCSALIALTFFIITTTTASWILNGPSQKKYMNVFGILWGTGLGWLHPQNTTMFVSLTPCHSQTEYMGIYNFAQSILGWLPPLIFSILNENGVPMNIGLASLNVFFFMALMALVLMGSCQVKKDDTQSHKAELESMLISAS
jgi:MFS transporter, UMF1 family